MENLLEQYSISEIILFVIFLAQAVKGVITFYDWQKDRLRKVFDKEYQQKNDKQTLETRFQEHSGDINELKENQAVMYSAITALGDKVDLLIESDKDDIKSFLTREHHYFCYQKGWIDDYSLECCNKRYEHYVQEKGNSFIQGFMEELRALPKVPPQVISNNSNADI